MIEKFGSAIYLVVVLHAFMLSMAGFCTWIGWRVRFRRDLALVRDGLHVPLPRGEVISVCYGNSYLVAAVALIILEVGTPLGLPFTAWLLLSIAVVIAQRIYRSRLESEAH